MRAPSMPSTPVAALLRRTLPLAVLAPLAAPAAGRAQVTSYAVVPNAGDNTASVIDTRTRTVRPTPVSVG